MESQRFHGISLATATANSSIVATVAGHRVDGRPFQDLLCKKGLFITLRSGCIILCLQVVFATMATAGPNRACNVNPETEDSLENYAVYNHAHQEFDQNAGGSETNHCYARACAGSFETYVDCEGVITILATGSGTWIRTWGLAANDWWQRTINITGSSNPRFRYKGKCEMKVTAETSRIDIPPSGDVFARANGMLYMDANGAKIANDDKECMSGTKNLDDINKPAIQAGAYTFNGVANAGYAEVPGTTANPPVALRTVAVDTGWSTFAVQGDGGSLTLKIFSFGLVKCKVPDNWCWARARVKHDSYVTPTNDWEVYVECWDDDDPAAPVLIQPTYNWTDWGN